MKEIIFLKPVYKDYIWGGTKLKTYFNKQVPFEKTAESWEISTNKNGKSIIRNGEYEGKELDELFNNMQMRKEVFGTKTSTMDRFPLLIKFIDANDNLSVQVHPNDEYAKERENDIGKTEMWYILECGENAQVICGLKDSVKQEEVKKIIKNGKIKENLKYISIKKGDAIYIPAGTIHALLGDTLLCEIQQNSDLTYRVYDWDRIGKDGQPRQLHIEKAIDVINVNNSPKIVETKSINEEIVRVVDSSYFKTDKITINGSFVQKSSEETFYTVNVIKGEGTIKTSTEEYKIKLGDSFIIPATLGEYIIQGELEILESYV